MSIFGLKSVNLLRERINFRRKFLSTAAHNGIRPFEDIPGPLSLPIIGTLYLYLPWIGRYQLERLHRNARKNYELFGPIIREQIVPGEFLVWLADPDDIAKMFQTEGKYPFRKSHLILEKYRLDRPHIYNSGGLLPTNGPEWARIRKTFQKGLSAPQDVQCFVKYTDEVITEWMNTRLEKVCDDSNSDFLPELSRLFLEVMGVAFFDVRFNSFSDEEIQPDSRTAQLIESAFVTNSTILKTDNGFQFWRKFETPIYKKFKKMQSIMESIAIDIVAMKMSTFRENSQNPPTLLERYLATSTLDFKDLIGVVCDFLLAGMDTTSYTSSFLLYNLANSPSVQEKVYQEAVQLLPSPTDPVTPEIYKKAEYAKCVIKETLRLNPVSIGVGRKLTTDVVFSGYQTVVVTLNQFLCRLEKYFPEADSFKPERWIKGDPSYQQVHPYLVIPFGHGQRTCIARRMAEQNMGILLIKLMRKFKLTWNGAAIDSKSLLINVPDGPIMLKWQKRDA